MVKKVYYLLLGDMRWYDVYKWFGVGYGFLLSVIFKKKEEVVVFYNGLNVVKGLSLGINFMFCCVYILLVYYNELDRVVEFGVEECLVWISVGVEEKGWLLGRVKGVLEVVSFV